MEKTILVPETKEIDIGLLSVDGENPNKMKKEDLTKLETSIRKYGFIVPVITNKSLLVADGEQRLTVARLLGMTRIPVIQLPIEDVDRRLLRQVLNKLRGEHEPMADLREFEIILGADRKQDLLDLLPLDENLLNYLKDTDETFDLSKYRDPDEMVHYSFMLTKPQYEDTNNFFKRLMENRNFKRKEEALMSIVNGETL